MSVVAVSLPVTMTLRAPTGPFRRADLEFHGVDHSRASFTVRLFFNRPDATADHRPTSSTATRAASTSSGTAAARATKATAGPHRATPHDRRTPHQLTPLKQASGGHRGAAPRAHRRATEVLLTAVAVLRSELVESWGTALDHACSLRPGPPAHLPVTASRQARAAPCCPQRAAPDGPPSHTGRCSGLPPGGVSGAHVRIGLAPEGRHFFARLLARSRLVPRLRSSSGGRGHDRFGNDRGGRPSWRRIARAGFTERSRSGTAGPGVVVPLQAGVS